MTNLKVFADLLEITQSMAEDLGLSALSQTDRQVLATIVLVSGGGRTDALHDDIKTHSLNVIARPKLCSVRISTKSETRRRNSAIKSDTFAASQPDMTN